MAKARKRQALRQKPGGDSFQDDTLDVLGEFAASFNMTLAQLLDMPSHVANWMLEKAGSDIRIPATAERNWARTPGAEGGFMDEGVTREMVRGAGQAAPAAVGIGAGLRTAAGNLPRVMGGESVRRGLLREAGKVRAGEDFVAGSLAGAGAAYGDDVGGQTGALIGGMAAPLATGPIVGASSKLASLAGNRRLGMPPSGRQLVDAGTREGVPVYTSDARPPGTFAGKMAQQTAEKLPFVGTGTMRQRQQKLRERAVDNTITRYAEHSYDEIINSLKTQANKVKRAAGSVLESTGKKLDPQGDVDISNTKAAIDAAKSKLGKKGVVERYGASLRELDNLSDAMSYPQTFTLLKENRTGFWDAVNAVDPTGRSQMTSKAKAAMLSVYKAMSDDMERAAREGLSPDEFAKWKRANAVWSDEATKLTRSKLKTVLDKGDVTPESVKTMLFSRNRSENEMLYNSLTPTGRTNARAAIISKMADDMARRSSGVSPNAFVSEMKKHNVHIDVFFKGEERERLVGLMRLLDATRRAQDAAVTTPTGQQVLGAGAGLAAWINPKATIGTITTVGLLGRIYETRAVRDALLRLGSARRGSSNYAQALIDSQVALAAAAQQDAEPVEGK
jgi:hypothetical protein